MEARRDHRLRVVSATVAAVLALAQPAVANHHEPIDWPLTATVDTTPDAVTVDAEVSSSTGSESDGSSSGGSSCWLEATSVGASLHVKFWDRPPKSLPFFLWCDGEMVGLVWRTIGGGEVPAEAMSPEDIAMQLRDRMPIPDVTVGINP